ncbi:MAG TPA: acylphosphatase [Acidimicrobiales bacterium]|nr:acylphosphatase [Acidimicrobiales bacterium]
MSEVVRRRAVARGRVQGVWYRDSARREAERLGVSGSATNLLDGSVALEVEGLRDGVDAFLTWAAEGPPRARVDALLVEDADPTGERGFVVR